MPAFPTVDQKPELQLDTLTAAGCEKVFVEKALGAQRDRSELVAALSYARQGDARVVWKLDRLARSMKRLVETVEDLDGYKIGFRSLTEAIDTTASRCSTSSARSPKSSGPSSGSAHGQASMPPRHAAARAAVRRSSRRTI